jgi:hypothetical protein
VRVMIRRPRQHQLALGFERILHMAGRESHDIPVSQPIPTRKGQPALSQPLLVCPPRHASAVPSILDQTILPRFEWMPKSFPLDVIATITASRADTFS